MSGQMSGQMSGLAFCTSWYAKPLVDILIYVLYRQLALIRKPDSAHFAWPDKVLHRPVRSNHFRADP